MSAETHAQHPHQLKPAEPGQDALLPHRNRHPSARVFRKRYRKIVRFAGANLAVTWFFELLLPRIGASWITERTRTRRLQRFGRKFHVLAVDLTGLMIKLGQFMSTRLDVLPKEFTDELAGLQDEVPAESFAAIRAAVETELGMPLERAFAWVDPTPLAAASLGQAHRAVLQPDDAQETGLDAVVLKVQRPNIADVVAVDLAALRKVAGWLSRVRIVSDRADMPKLAEEFATTCVEEIDYLNEAANAESFAAMFADDARVAAPAVVWERTTRRVLTLEDVSAIKLMDVAGLAAAGIDPRAVAAVFSEIMFRQLFIEGVFHADPHPGNLFVTPNPAGSEHPWRITFIDFGMMGQVPDRLLGDLRRLLIAAAARDAAGIVDGINRLGVLLPSADMGELERALVEIFDRFGGLDFSELREIDPRELREFGLQFGHLIRAMPFQLPENFLLIGRTASLVSGVCGGLDREYNVWESVQPFAAELLRAESGGVVADVVNSVARSTRTALQLPGRLDALLTALDRGTVSVDSPRLRRRVDVLEQTARRLISAVLFSGLLVTGAVLRTDDPGLGAVLFSLSLLPLLHVLFGRRG